jgi:putative ABC transport system substrate-binding protein
MKRREFIRALGGVAVLPLAARAQPSPMPVLGILSGTNSEVRLLGAIRQGLEETGYAEGRNVVFEARFAEGRFERLPALAAELADKKAAVIIGMQSASAPLAAKKLTPPIPVVFSIGGDPVRLGLVESLNRPGGNVTGATFLVNSLSAKRLELLRDMLPAVITMGLLVNPKNPAAAAETTDVQAAARTLGLQLLVRNASSPQEIDAAFAAFAEQKVGAVTFAADATFNAARAQLIALAAQNKLPTMYFYREFANDGGLITYGGYDTDAYRLAGVYAGRIIKGEKPADLPVQQVTRVELVINLKTAKAQGIEIPLALLGRADDVIE